MLIAIHHHPKFTVTHSCSPKVPKCAHIQKSKTAWKTLKQLKILETLKQRYFRTEVYLVNSFSQNFLRYKNFTP